MVEKAVVVVLDLDTVTHTVKHVYSIDPKLNPRIYQVSLYCLFPISFVLLTIKGSVVLAKLYCGLYAKDW
jgi:hypothetical protein